MAREPKPGRTRVKLLPCPMCGDQPRVLRKSTVIGQCTIYCGKLAGHVVRVDGENVTEACRMWNQRPSEPRFPERPTPATPAEIQEASHD